MILKHGLLFVSMMLGSAPAFAGGDLVGNGGGLSEKNILIAYQNLERYAKPCLRMSSCRLDRDEKAILAKIVGSMSDERKTADQVQFVSENEKPDFFHINGEVKVAKTGSEVGSPIYVNLDLLYTKTTLGTIEPMGIPMALAILVHEFGHHVSRASHTELDLLGVKLSMFLQNGIQSTAVLPGIPRVGASVVALPDAETFPQVFLSIDDRLVDLTEGFRDRIFCPVFKLKIPLLPFPSLQLGHQDPKGAIFHNVHWEVFPKNVSEGKKSDFVVLGNLTQICPHDDGYEAINSFKARVGFSVMPVQGQLQLINGSVWVQQIYDPWYRFLRLDL